MTDVTTPVIPQLLHHAHARDHGFDFFMAGDLFDDWRSGADASHLAVELIVLALAAGGIVLILPGAGQPGPE